MTHRQRQLTKRKRSKVHMVNRYCNRWVSWMMGMAGLPSPRRYNG